MLNRDAELKKARGYTDPKSFVRNDGSERLMGKDWKKRKRELLYRSAGNCERVYMLCRAHALGCNGEGGEPHHITPRSKRRDDRLENLANLSHACHSAEDSRKIGGRK